MAATGSITAVAVSGGVDSLYALAFLKESGESIFALHARMLPPHLAPATYEDSLARLHAACAALDVPLHVIDCVDDFARAVIDPFVRAYADGTTPNPCAHCNAAVKFGLLLDAARERGANRIATGHYVRLEHTATTTALYAADDTAKDQSYFLSLVPQDRLRYACSPLANKSKNEIRAYLQARNLNPPVPAESQEICFVPNDDYRAFLQARAAETGISLPGPGPVTLPDNTRISTHKGLWQYTEGQRRGLGIAWKEPLYVIAKNTATNALITGTAAQLGGTTITADRCNFLLPFTEWPETIFIRTRFRQQPRPATARLNGTRLTLHEATPSGPYARGQIATIYDATHRVLAGGVII